jgi:chaperonin cofactor prefoldin
MQALIDTIRGVLKRHHELHIETVNHLIDDLERDDRALEQKLEELQEAVSGLRGDRGEDARGDR